VTAKKVWAVSTNGPDWTDLEMAMRAVGGCHSGVVTVTLSPLGIGATGGFSIDTYMNLDVLPGSSLPMRVGIQSQWPCIECRDLAAHLLGQIYRLDYEMSKVYETSALWQ
jgi:hypothetical protein